MADDTKPRDKVPAEKGEGTFHYNPVGMAGEKINPEEQPQPRTGGAQKDKGSA